MQIVVMGVSATGKSTVGIALAERLGWEFIEGDDLHPRSNVAKMESGVALTDEDRTPWLELIRQRAAATAESGRSAVITCSALKRAYRDALRAGVGPMFFVHLTGDEEVLASRMARRERHFMPTGLLRSQLDTLEPLEADEDGVVVDVGSTIDQVVAEGYEAVKARLSE